MPYIRAVFKIKRTSASELGKWVMAVWEDVAGKTAKQSLKKSFITNAVDGTVMISI
jgi:hypothetical protein